MDLSLTTSTTAREQLRIKEKCFHPTASFVEFEKEQVEQSIPQCFERVARTHPERLALKIGNLVYTYDSLNKAANRLAHVLLHSSRAFVAFLSDPTHGVVSLLAMCGIDGGISVSKFSAILM